MKRLFLGMMLCACALSLWAVPAKRITITVEQPDGTTLTLTQNGDEFFHYLATEDGRMVKSNGKGYYYADIVDGYIVPSEHLAHPLALRSEKEQHVVEGLPSIRQFCELALNHEETAQRVRSTRAAQRVGEVPQKGEVKIPVLLVQYSDLKFSSSDPLATFEGHINGENYKDEGGYGSVREYFVDQSNGKFTPIFDIIGPITLSNSMKYYGENDDYGGSKDKNVREMIIEACQKADVDFSQYDNDGDDIVDIVYVIYAGYGENASIDQLENTVWPHQWQLAEPLTLDGVQISKYACNNELHGNKGNTIDGIGTFCHEFSHCLGLPDFYPTGEDQSPFGMESWSLMHYGSYSNDGHTPCGYTGYELDFLGWRELIVIDEPQDITLTALSEGGHAYKIVNDANPDEYYVVENRRKSKWDTYVPAEGMLITHVDYSESAWYYNTVNNYPEHQRMTIIPADNKPSRDTQYADTYPGTTNNTSLTSSSKPAATVFTGEYMGKDITDISEKNGYITFSFMKGALGVPTVEGPFNVTENSFSVSWDQVPGIKEYEVSLAVLEESPYMLEEDFNKVPGGDTDISNLIDSYTIQKGWQAANVFGIEGAIRVGSTSERGALVTPYIRTDSTCFTILYTIRKSSSSDKDAGMVLCVTDDEWLDEDGYNELYGYGLTIKNDEWMTYFLVMDSIGDNSYLYIDTRDFGQTAGGNSVRVDIDALYVLEGDLSEELTGDKAPAKVANAKRQPTPQRVAEEVDINAIIACNNTRATRAGEEEEKRYKTTIVYTNQTSDLSYQFKDLDGGLYRCMVRSVRDEVYSRYSNGVDVLLVDSMLPQTAAAFDLYIDKDSVYMTTDNGNAELYYTIDGTMPTSYSTHYEGPFELLDKATIYVIAKEPEHRRSEVVGIRNWFKTENETFRISSDIDPQVSLSEAMGGNSGKDYAGHYVVPTEVIYDSLSYKVLGIDASAFSNATSLRSVEIDNKSINRIGDKLFHGCTALNVVVWDIDLPIYGTMFDEESYHNLLIYTTEDIELSHSLINEGRMIQVCGGASENLTLDGGHPFYCPRAFTAESVSYQRSFAQTTGKGDAAGWETIVLPFDVQKFAHASKGEIAPFGVEANSNFWLAELTNEGFASTTALRANVPYIIAMPNNTEYGNNSLSGTITFSATQATIQATNELTNPESTEFMFVPTYESVAPGADTYVLNVGNKYEENSVTYKPGSVFVPNKYTVAPFSAYVVASATHKSAPLFRIQKEKDVENATYTFSIKALNGIVYLTLPEAKIITVFDITGRKVCSVACEMGVNEITNLSEGIYLIENVKIVVKH